MLLGFREITQLPGDRPQEGEGVAHAVLVADTPVDRQGLAVELLGQGRIAPFRGPLAQLAEGAGDAVRVVDFAAEGQAFFQQRLGLGGRQQHCQVGQGIRRSRSGSRCRGRAPGSAGSGRASGGAALRLGHLALPRSTCAIVQRSPTARPSVRLSCIAPAPARIRLPETPVAQRDERQRHFCAHAIGAQERQAPLQQPARPLGVAQPQGKPALAQEQAAQHPRRVRLRRPVSGSSIAATASPNVVSPS